MRSPGRPRPPPRSAGGAACWSGVGRQVEEHVPHGAALLAPPDELPHHPQPAVHVDAPGVGRLVAGDDPEQGRLAGAVGADERHVLAVAHAEAHALEQLDAPGRAARHPVHVDRAHGRWTLPTRPVDPTVDSGLTRSRPVASSPDPGIHRPRGGCETTRPVVGPWSRTTGRGGGAGSTVPAMRAVVQRVTRASVTVGDEIVGAIGAGLCVLVGVTHDDDAGTAAKLADKLWHLRLFDDADGVMNVSASDAGAEVLVVSQFTLVRQHREGPAAVVAGRRPSRARRAAGGRGGRSPAGARATVATGRFRTDMEVELRQPWARHPDRGGLMERPLPAWYDDAKLGIFVHWTAAAVPAYAPVTDSPFDLAAEGGWEEAMRCSPYVEWYQNSIAIEGSPAALHHAEVHGDRPYDDFVETFLAGHAGWQADAVGRPVPGGAAPATSCSSPSTTTASLLWPSAHAEPAQGRGGAASATSSATSPPPCAAADLRFGTYYSGGLDWTLRRPARCATSRRCSAPSRRRASTSPTPTRTGTSSSTATGPTCSGTTSATRRPPTSPALFERYYAAVPDGVVNNRFDWMGQSAGAGALRLRHARVLDQGRRRAGSGRAPAASARASATTARRTSRRYLSPDELVRMFVDIVAHGGNLLLNVGPNADGTIPWRAGAAPARPRLVAPHERRRHLRHPPVVPHRSCRRCGSTAGCRRSRRRWCAATSRGRAGAAPAPTGSRRRRWARR